MKEKIKKYKVLLILLLIVITCIIVVVSSCNNFKKSEVKKEKVNEEITENSEPVEGIVDDESSNKLDKEDIVTSYTVDITNNKIYIGKLEQIIIKTNPDNVPLNIEYASTDSNVATVDKFGQIMGVGEGVCFIEVNLVDIGQSRIKVQVLKEDIKSNSNVSSNRNSNNISNSNSNDTHNSNLNDGNIRVQDIKLDKNDATYEVGRFVLLNATIIPSNATNKEIIWTSSNEDIAEVDKGIVYSKKPGVVYITATTKDGNKRTQVKITFTNVLTATFYNLMSNKEIKLTCSSFDNNGCTITVPNATLSGYKFLGWSTKTNTKTPEVSVNEKIKITKDVTYYARFSKTLTATFVGTNCSHGTTIKKTCNIYNSDVNCSIQAPACEKVGVYDNLWLSEDSKNQITKGANLYLKNDQTFYPLFSHARAISGENQNYMKDRNFKIVKTYKIGETRFEYQQGIPNNVIEDHYSLLQKVYKQLPSIFVDAKVFVMTEDTYKKYSSAYALTTYGSNLVYIDLQYDVDYGKISENGTIHELAHAWDFSYSKLNGSQIIEQKNIKEFYTSLSDSKKKYLTIEEWFAALVTEYYWHYLENDPTERSYAGYKDNYTTEEKRKAVNLLDSYFNKKK